MSINKFYESIVENKGGSYNFVTGDFNPTTGFMVSIKGCESRSLLSKFDKTVLNYFLVENIDKLCLDVYYLGAWIEGDNIYLDVSVRELNKSRALKLAKTNKQLAIYDCETGVAIHL